MLNAYWFSLGIFVSFCLGLLTGIRVIRDKIYLKLAKILSPEELQRVRDYDTRKTN
jgi:hypothetical protein